MVDENEVRAAAGLTTVIGAAAFSYAYFTRQYVPLRVVASLFALEFLIRQAASRSLNTTSSSFQRSTE